MNKPTKSRFSIVLDIILLLSAVSLSISISAMEIGLGLLLIILIVFLFRRRIDITADCPYFIPFFIYWLTTLLPFFFGSKEAVLESNTFDIWPMLYFFVGFYFVSQKNLRSIFFFLVLGCFALSLSSLRDVFILNQLRADGFLGYMTGSEIMALGAVLSFGLVALGYEKNKFIVSFYLLACLAAIFGIISTETRGSLISLVVAASFILIFRYRGKGIIFATIFIFIIGLGVYFSPIGARFFEVVKDFWNVDTSHGWRIELWKQTWTLIKEYPIFGIGNGAYENLVRLLMPTSANLPLSHAHNGLLVQLVLFGLVGLGAFCFFYGKIMVTFIRNMKGNNFAFLGVALMIAYFMQSFTENNFQDSELLMFSSFTFGILLGAIKKQISR